MNRPLSEYLSEIPEFRRQNKNFAHPLTSILLLSICAIFHGAEDFYEIEDFGHERKDFLSGFLSFPHGIPSHDTITRVFRKLDSAQFNDKFMAWMRDLLADSNLTPKHISIDGKTLRGAKNKLHLIHAVSTELGVCLGQVKTAEKSNEITAIPNLLEMLYLKGCIVSIDAMGTQKDIAAKIIEKEGDYFLALKGNHKTLLEQVQHQLSTSTDTDTFTKADFSGSHNAVTEYEVKVCHDLTGVANAAEWAGLQSIASVQTTSDKRGTETRYYISSIEKLTAQHAYHLSRDHWSVENQLHWQLDVTLKEDSKRNRKDCSAENFSLLRKILLNRVQMQEPKLSKKRIIKKMAWNPEYCLQMLAKIIAT